MINKIYLKEDININMPRNVSCIGYFDGVHLGHQELIKNTIKIAGDKNIESCLITFYPDPLEVITGKRIKHLNSLNNRIKLFEKFGIKNVIIIEFNKDIMNMKPDLFINKILNKLNIDTLITGFDFHFGQKGLGDVKYLKRYKNKTFKIVEVEEVKYYGKKISSTRIKKAIMENKIELANKMLGYKYK